MEEQDVAKKLKELCGLRKWTEEQARFVLEACRASGEPPTTFARRWGFYSQRMYWWKERLRRTDAEASDPAVMAPTSASTFLPVTVLDVGAGWQWLTTNDRMANERSCPVRSMMLDACSTQWTVRSCAAPRRPWR